MGYVPLHVHSHFSLLDGLESPKQLVQRAKDVGIEALALTDHGTMGGLIDFYFSCKEENIKPIMGSEFYFAEDRLIKEKTAHGNSNYHQTILAKDIEGWKNLITLTTEAASTGFYRNPRVDFSLLEQHNDGLIVGSGCAASIISKCIESDDFSKVKWLFNFFKKNFDGRFFAELTSIENIYENGDLVVDQKKINKYLIQYAKEFGIPFTIMSDAHYAEKEHYDEHDLLLAVQTKKKLKDKDRFRFGTKEVWLKSEDDMWDYWHREGKDHISEEDFATALENTVKVAEMTSINLEEYYKSYRMPKLDVKDARDALFNRALNNKERTMLINRLSDSDQSKYVSRLNRELSLIVDQGFASYFMMTADLTDYMRDNKIMKGLARGSAGGSLLAYMLGITDIDPMVHNLSFERFMNENKASMPDIDIDIDDEKRQEILDYFIGKYGTDNVSQIGTRITMQSKLASKDVGRTLGISFDKLNDLSDDLEVLSTVDNFKGTKEEVNNIISDLNDQLISSDVARNSKLTKKLESWKKIKNISDKHPQWLPMSSRVSGKPKAIGKHAAGIVVADDSLKKILPLQHAKNEALVTEWSDGLSRKELSDVVKVLKFDLLGLSNLGIIQNTIDLIRQRHNETKRLDLNLSDQNILNSIKLDDPYVFDNCLPNKLMGVFQFDTYAAERVLNLIVPENIIELCALNAMNRPAALQANVPSMYAQRKSGKTKIEYSHPLMEEILRETYGLIIYQEQVMEIANKIGGLTPSETDKFRKVLVKVTESNKEKEDKERISLIDKFQVGALEKGMSPDDIVSLSEKLIYFSGYGFNKSHSRSYALLAYYTMYLKTYFYPEFLTAYLNKRPENLDRAIREAGFDMFLPVDVNQSNNTFILDESGRIRVGFSAIKGLGAVAVKEIIEKRPFIDLDDLKNKVEKRKVNKTRVSALIKSGALTSLKVKTNLESELQVLGIPLWSIKRQLFLIKRLKNDLRLPARGSQVLNNEDIEYVEDGTSVISLGFINKIEKKFKSGGYLAELYDGTSYISLVKYSLNHYDTYPRLGQIVLIEGEKKTYARYNSTQLMVNKVMGF